MDTPPAFRRTDRQDTATASANRSSTNNNTMMQRQHQRQQQHGTSIDMHMDPIPLFPDIVRHDEGADVALLQEDDGRHHPLLLTKRKMDIDDDDDDGRAAFSAAATDTDTVVGIHKGHKRGDTFEPLPFRTSADSIGCAQDAPAAAGFTHRPSDHRRQYAPPPLSHGGGRYHLQQQPPQSYEAQPMQMQQLYPPYDPAARARRQTQQFDPSSPARTQPPITSHAQAQAMTMMADQYDADAADGRNAAMGTTARGHHRKVPSFVTPLRGYDDDAAMIDDAAVPTTTQHQQPYGGYHHPHHHGHHHHHHHNGQQHGYYPPYHLWQHPYGGGGGTSGQPYSHHHATVRPHHHHRGGVPKPPPPPPPAAAPVAAVAPPIFHPLADREGGASSNAKHTIKRRYFQDVPSSAGTAYATPTPAALASAYHPDQPPLPAYGRPIHPSTEQEGQQGHPAHPHRRGPSIIFDNDEDWHQQSPTVLYTSWSTTGTTGDSSPATGTCSRTTTTGREEDGDAVVRIMAPTTKPKSKSKSKKKSTAIKKKRRSKSAVSSLAIDGMPPLPPIVNMTNDDDDIDSKREAGDAADDEEDVLVSSLDMDLPLGPLVHFQKRMESSEETQKALEKWDKKMGLKRSHSKTMWDSDRSRQNLKKAILGIQRAKLRQRIIRPSKSTDGESNIVRGKGVASNVPEPSAVAGKGSFQTYLSPTFEIRTPPATTEGAVIALPSTIGVAPEAAELSSDSSILSESRDASNQIMLAVSIPPKNPEEEDSEPTGAFFLGSPTTSGGTHTKTSSASDIQPLSPAEPSPIRVALSPKWAFKEV